MTDLFIAIEGKLFCFALVLFLWFFRSKCTLNLPKRLQWGYLMTGVGIFSTLLVRFVTGEAAHTACCAFSGTCYAIAVFLFFYNKKLLAIAISILFGLFSFYTLYLGVSLAIYGLVLTYVIHFILEQFHLVTKDNLTGLYNLYARKLEIAEQEREYQRDHNDSFYVFSCDLDKFKSINDTWGHPEGDRALGLVADALTTVAKRFNAEVFRVGGDEFQIIADTSDEKEAEKIEQALQEQFDLIHFRDDFEIEISVGKVLYNGKQSVDDLLAEADQRLYAEKKKRKQ